MFLYRHRALHRFASNKLSSDIANPDSSDRPIPVDICISPLGSTCVCIGCCTVCAGSVFCAAMCDVNAVCGVSVMPQILVTRMVSSHWTLQCFKHRHAVLPYHLCRQKCLYENLSVFAHGNVANGIM